MRVRPGLFKRGLQASLQKGNGGMQVMSATEQREFQEYFQRGAECGCTAESVM